jgi:hypothetical protein
MLPNFIVIGAAKAGTTALYWYLAEHPEVVMSSVKETNYFAFGLDDDGQPLYGDPELHHFPVQSLSDYEKLFADAGDSVAIGEASPIYLECPQAAGRIRDLIPAARIICGLRDPVDRAYSDYMMFLRSRGRRFDAARDLSVTSAWAQPDSHWMRISRYHEALSRYFEAFPRDHLHFFLFDDLKHDPQRVVQDIYRFLDVDSAFQCDLLTPHNVGGVPSSTFLERIFTSRAIRAAVEPWISKGAVNWVRRVRTVNLAPAPKLPPQLKQELVKHFRGDIARTSELIGRSLEEWL